MQQKQRKIKLIIFSAILLVIVLFVSSICLTISINEKQKQIKKQQTEIDKLNNILNYYEQNEENPKQPSNGVIIEED